jgi:hypothetical protein
MDVHVGSASTLIDADVTCARCGYNLRTLPQDGKCPECGGSVADSLGAQRRRALLIGPELSLQPARWLFLVGGSMLIYVMLPVLNAAVLTRFVLPGARVVLCVLFLMFGIVGWCMTRPTNGEPDRIFWLRTMARAMVCFWSGCTVVVVIRYLCGQEPARNDFGYSLEMILAMYAAAIGTTLFFAYLAHLALRMRSSVLRWLCWGLSATSISMLLTAALVSRAVPMFGLPFSLPVAEHPILGSLFRVVFDIWNLFATRTPIRWSSLGSTLWDLCATATMIAFGTMLIRMGAAAARSRKTAASSRP